MTETVRLDSVEKYLRFESMHAPDIRHELKTMTLRYGFERDIGVGDRVALVDQDDVVIAFAEIDLALEMTAQEFVRLKTNRHQMYRRVEHLVEVLGDHYPDAAEEFDGDTVLDVFGWRLER